MKDLGINILATIICLAAVKSQTWLLQQIPNDYKHFTDAAEVAIWFVALGALGFVLWRSYKAGELAKAETKKYHDLIKNCGLSLDEQVNILGTQTQKLDEIHRTMTANGEPADPFTLSDLAKKMLIDASKGTPHKSIRLLRILDREPEPKPAYFVVCGSEQAHLGGDFERFTRMQSAVDELLTGGLLRLLKGSDDTWEVTGEGLDAATSLQNPLHQQTAKEQRQGARRINPDLPSH